MIISILQISKHRGSDFFLCAHINQLLICRYLIYMTIQLLILILNKLTSFAEMMLFVGKVHTKFSVLLRMSPRCGRKKEVAARSIKLCLGPSYKRAAQVLRFDENAPRRRVQFLQLILYSIKINILLFIIKNKNYVVQLQSLVAWYVLVP